MKTPDFIIREGDGPLDRLYLKGIKSLSNSELISIIIKNGISQEESLILSHQILSKYDLKQLSTISTNQLKEFSGINTTKAAQILACIEIGNRIESLTLDPKKKISSPEDVYRRLFPQMRELKKEIFIELCLDTKNQILKEEIIFMGSLNANIVHPREVFKLALLESAAHIIVAHNHPSGDPSPSREDIEITKKLTETGKIMGITVLDHVIIGDGSHFSMKEAGHI